MKQILTFEGGRELTFDVPEGATFSGLCGTCGRCDGPLPILRADGEAKFGSYWAICPPCGSQYVITGIEGPNEKPVFCMIPYHHSDSASGTWMGLERKA